jgi:glycosyltransferase involved in cell wall biosynthesis
MKASVIIPTKNRPMGLVRAVTSVFASSLAQDEYEVVVVDDGSTAPAAEVLTRWSSIRLTVVSNPGAAGPAGARNHGVRSARGETVFFLDDDDQIVSDYLPRVLLARSGLAAKANYGFSCLISGQKVTGKHGETGILTAGSPLKDRLGGLGAGFWITKKDFIAVGGLDEGLRVNEDLEFCIRLAKNNLNCWYSSVPGVDISPMPSISGNEMPSITWSTRASERSSALEFVLQHHADFLSQHPDVRNRLIERVVKFRARGGDLRGALSFGASQDGRRLAVIVNAILGLLTSERSG